MKSHSSGMFLLSVSNVNLLQPITLELGFLYSSLYSFHICFPFYQFPFAFCCWWCPFWCLWQSPSSVFITACKRSCWKVMFLHLSVILFTWGRGCVQERWPLKQAVRILLECILVSNMSVKKCMVVASPPSFGWRLLVLPKFCKIGWHTRFLENVLDSFSCFYIEIAYSYMLSFLVRHTISATWARPRKDIYEAKHNAGVKKFVSIIRIGLKRAFLGVKWPVHFWSKKICVKNTFRGKKGVLGVKWPVHFRVKQPVRFLGGMGV